MTVHSVRASRVQPDRCPDRVRGDDGPDGRGSDDIDRTPDSDRSSDPDGSIYQRGGGWGPDSYDGGSGCGRDGGSEI
jgi:hypothetical protein